MQPTDHMSTRGRREDNDGRKGRQSGRWMEKKTKGRSVKGARPGETSTKRTEEDELASV
jgi:hypothetical protein